MEFLVIFAIGGILVLIASSGSRTSRHQHRSQTPSQRPTKTARPRPNRQPPAPFDPKTAQPSRDCLTGRAYVTDGDTITIAGTQIRLFGIDAPEMNHPYGKKAKWALVALCKGQQIQAEVTATDDHGRTVARCTLPDGRDLSAEMVKQGLAIDWPKYSGGLYRPLEVPDARKKMWLADARQKGRMHVWAEYEARQKARSSRS